MKYKCREWLSRMRIDVSLPFSKQYPPLKRITCVAQGCLFQSHLLQFTLLTSNPPLRSRFVRSQPLVNVFSGETVKYNLTLGARKNLRYPVPNPYSTRRGTSFERHSLTFSERPVALQKLTRYLREKVKATGSARLIVTSWSGFSMLLRDRRVTEPVPMSPSQENRMPSLVASITTIVL